MMPLVRLYLRYNKVLAGVMSVNQDLGSSGKAVEPRTEGTLTIGILSAIPKRKTLESSLELNEMAWICNPRHLEAKAGGISNLRPN